MTRLPTHPSNLAAPRRRKAARANDAALDAAKMSGLYEAVAALRNRPEGFSLFILCDSSKHFKVGLGALFGLGFKYRFHAEPDDWRKFIGFVFPVHSK